MSHLKKYVIGIIIVLGTSFTFSQESNQNLLPNPGFENDLESWGYDPDFGEYGMSEISFDDPAAVHSGKKGAKLTVTEAGYYNWHIKLKIPWEWKAVKNQKYRLAFWAKSHNTSKNLPLGLSDGSPGFVEKEEKVFKLSSDWKQFEFEFTSKADGVGSVRLIFLLGLDTGVFYFDDFVLNTVGEIGIRFTQKKLPISSVTNNNSIYKIWDIKGRNVSAALLNKGLNRIPIIVFQQRQKHLPIIVFQK
ncbi:MAG: carbohydrate binding domain-containing protein [Chitinispirillia bacterium]|jgi:hypothetical protein